MNIREEVTMFESDILNWDSIYIGGGRLVENRKIKGVNKKIKVFSFEPYAQELFELYTDGKFPQNVIKDLEKGDIINVINIKGIKDNALIVELESGINVEVYLPKEKKFIERFGYASIDAFTEAIKHPHIIEDLINHKLQVYVTDIEPYQKASLWKAYSLGIQQEFLKEISEPSQAYVAKVKEANKGGFFVEVQGIDAFMPGSLSAANKLENFEDLIGTDVIVMIEDYINEMKSFIVSHKKYIEYVLPSKIKNLDLNQQYEGTITGTSKYGIFIEFDLIFTGLLHISKMNDDTVSDFKARLFKPGDPIKFFINEITKDNRLILTQIDPIEKEKAIELFIEKNKESVIKSSVAAIMNFGIIVSIGDQSGLIPNKEFRKRKFQTSDYNVKDIIEVLFDNYTDGKITFKLSD